MKRTLSTLLVISLVILMAFGFLNCKNPDENTDPTVPDPDIQGPPIDPDIPDPVVHTFGTRIIDIASSSRMSRR